MEEGRWQGGGENSGSDSGTHIYAPANSRRSHTWTHPHSHPAQSELRVHRDTRSGFQIHMQRTHNHTQIPCSWHAAPTCAHTLTLSRTSRDLPGPIQALAHAQMHPSALAPWASQTQALSGFRQPSGLEPRDGWRCGHGAWQGGGRVWQGAVPPGRPWRAVGVSGAQAWCSTGWRG